MYNKWFLYAVIVFIFSSCDFLGQSEGKWSPEKMAERQTEMMTEMLNLTDDQVKEVTRVNTQFAKDMVKIRKSAKGDREQMRTSMNEWRNSKDDAMQEVLTEDQFTAYKESEQNRRQKGMRNGSGNREER